ncbi:MAG: co-chaperone GroES [Verrucomicrobiota bacterium]
MKIHPLNGRVVAKPLEPEEGTSGGIIIPDTAKEKSSEAEVVAIAEDATEEVAIGDRIICKKVGGVDINIDGEDFIILTGDDIVAKYKAVDQIPE